MTATVQPDRSVPNAAIDEAVFLELVALYERQSHRTGPAIGITALIIGMAAWPRAPHWAIIAWVTAEWSTLLVRRWGFLRLVQADVSARRKIRGAIALRGLHALTNAAAVLFFPYLTDTGKTLITLVLAGLTTGAISTSGGYLPVYLSYALPAMGSLILGWWLTPLHGEETWLAMVISPLLAAYLLVMVGLARDSYKSLRAAIVKRIEEEHLNQQLRSALQEAETANAAKTRFLASASHDLRQPLHSLSLFFATLRLQAGSQDNVQLFRHIDEALTSLQAQMNTLLDMSKLDAGMVRLDWQSFELRPLLERILTTYEPLAHQARIDLELVCPEGLHVHSDTEQLTRIVRNVVDNAMKYTAQGRVCIEARQDEDMVILRIADTGCGIAPSLHRQVFEEFFQVDNPERDRSRGLGLGLSIVKRVARLLYVEVELTSEPGVGTSITLRIPKGSPRPQAQGATDARDTQPSMPMCNVLVLDDELAVRTGMQALLKRMGCEVMLASSISEALSQAAERPPDLVLADLRLRGQENGIEAIRQLRHKAHNLPAIIITGDTAPDRLRQVQAAGLPLLHKPVNADTLMHAIASALDAAG